MSNIVNFHQNVNVSKALRSIADEIESGRLPGLTAALVVDCEIFMCGDVMDRYAAQEAIWHFQYGISRLMQEALEA